jgi:hypothetical protein
MEHNNRVKFPPYLKRRLIYQAKRFGQFKCQVDFTSTGIAEFKFKSYDRDTFGAKRLLLQIIEEETQEYNRFLKEFKLDLEDPQVISVGDLDVVKVEFDPASHHPTQVASYLTNYSNNKAYIVTPASPGVYSQPKTPLDIATTANTVLGGPADHNKELFKYPIEPTLIACQNLVKDFSLANYDIFTDRNNLRKLLSWASGEDPSLFRVDFELHENFLILRRCDEEQTEANASTHSIATAFEQKCVKKPSHEVYHIISTFKLGNNRVLMRYEVDGQLPPKNSADDLAARLQSTSLQEKKQRKFQGSDVPFVENGNQQNQLDYIELKTLMKDRYRLDDPKFKSELSSIYFQSFIAGINNFAFGLKETIFLGRGKKILQISKIVKETLKSLQPYVELTQMLKAIKKVIALLNYVQQKMKAGIDKASLLYDPQSNQLSLYRRKGESFMPPHFPFKE